MACAGVAAASCVDADNRNCGQTAANAVTPDSHDAPDEAGAVAATQIVTAAATQTVDAAADGVHDQDDAHAHAAAFVNSFAAPCAAEVIQTRDKIYYRASFDSATRPVEG